MASRRIKLVSWLIVTSQADAFSSFSFLPAQLRASTRLIRQQACPVPTRETHFTVSPRRKSSFGFRSSSLSSSLSSSSSIPTDEDYAAITPTTYNAQGEPNDHRYSADDWWQNVKSLPRSTILRAIQGPVVTIMVWSLVVSSVYTLLRQVSLASIADRMVMSSQPHSFLVSALGLLLVFRTNSAYQRFAEGRKIWENILSISRNISRLACLYEQDLGKERKIRVFRLLGSFPYLLHHHIQPQCLDPQQSKALQGTEFALELKEECVIGPSNDQERRRKQRQQQRSNSNRNIAASVGYTIRRRMFGKASYRTEFIPQAHRTRIQCTVDRRALPWCLLPPLALHKCADSANRPLWVCDRLSRELADVMYSNNFTSRERLAFLSQIDKLSKSIGECERIHQTAVPLNYARHSLRSLTIWLFSLPFALVKEFGLLTAPVMGVIAWLLFGVYQIGCSIEDPFQGSLRLSLYCDNIYRDVMHDAVLKNERDSAFKLESELYEWDLLGDIEEENKMLLTPPMKPHLLDSSSLSEELEDDADLDDYQVDEDLPKPSSSSLPPPSPKSLTKEDPDQPRP